MSQPRVLYLSYDGALEPLGQSQILPYLRRLAARGAAITLLTFEKRADRRRPERIRFLRDELSTQGIHWVPLAYHKRPTVLATSWDVLVGALSAWRIIRRDRIQLLHARSDVAALIAWLLKRATGTRMLFDMRGFWADERVEGGHWAPTGRLYRVAKRLERVFLEEADEIITLTEWARDTVQERLGAACPPITVIPTCVDLERFSPATAAGPPANGPVFVYAGSVGTWYLLPEMLRFMERAAQRFPGARLLLLTRQTEEAAAALRACALNPGAVTMVTADTDEVPGWLARAQAGLAFYKPGFSRRGTCPTKIGEYLAMGLPVVVNTGVGDTEMLIGDTQTGAVLPEFTPEAYDRALEELQRLWTAPDLAARCRAAAERSCALPTGVERYWGIYQRAAGGNGVGPLPGARGALRVLALIPYLYDTVPGQRFRIEQWARLLAPQGVRVQFLPFESRQLKQVLYTTRSPFKKLTALIACVGRRLRDVAAIHRQDWDVIYLYRELLPIGPPWLEGWLATKGIPILYDFDDAIFLPAVSEANQGFQWLKRPRKTWTIARLSRHVIVGNEHLKSRVQPHTSRVSVIPTTIDIERYLPKPDVQIHGVPTIGWSGSLTTLEHLRTVAPALRRLRAQRLFRLKVFGSGDFSLEGLEVDSRPWSADAELVELASFDIGIMPLPDDAWARGKCGLKALQYMALGIPTIASPVGVNAEIIEDGTNGFLASREAEWVEKLSRLLSEEPLRRRFAAEGRRTVERWYSAQRQAPRLLALIEQLSGRQPAPARTRLALQEATASP